MALAAKKALALALVPRNALAARMDSGSRGHCSVPLCGSGTMSAYEGATMAESKRERAPMAVVLIVLLIVLPCVYVLSYGPAYWLLQRSWNDSQDSYVWASRADDFYLPLHWLGNHSITIDTALSEYRNYWNTDKRPVYTPP
jgi:hypothetical protein